MPRLFDEKTKVWATIFALLGAIMPFVMLAINKVMTLFIDKTNVSGVEVTFSVAQVNLRNSIASGGFQGKISEWLAGLFGYTLPDAIANLPGATFSILGIPLSAVLAGAIAGAVAGIAAHLLIKNVSLVGALIPNSGYGLYFGYVVIASLIGYGIVLVATGLPDYVGGMEIAIAMGINALAQGWIAQQIAKYI